MGQTDSPEIPDKGETSEISHPAFLRGREINWIERFVTHVCVCACVCVCVLPLNKLIHSELCDSLTPY